MVCTLKFREGEKPDPAWGGMGWGGVLVAFASPPLLRHLSKARGRGVGCVSTCG